MVRHWAPERGQAIWIDMNLQAVHEQMGRPALVLSPVAYNRARRSALICSLPDAAVEEALGKLGTLLQA
ncbi:MAG: hypothetical protein HY236_00355 [Acidobacteria bacterium]|nr:hypothetical protein [Acidobacteriota bacterium]